MSDITVSMPLDANARPVAPLFGYSPADDAFYPLTIADNGDGTYKLVVDAAVSIGSVTISGGVSGYEAVVTADGRLLVSVDDNALQQTNMTVEYTYNSDSKVETTLEYPTGSVSGAPAKLTTFTYGTSGYSTGKVTKTVVTNSTVSV